MQSSQQNLFPINNTSLPVPDAMPPSALLDRKFFFCPISRKLSYNARTTLVRAFALRTTQHTSQKSTGPNNRRSLSPPPPPKKKTSGVLRNCPHPQIQESQSKAALNCPHPLIHKSQSSAPRRGSKSRCPAPRAPRTKRCCRSPRPSASSADKKALPFFATVAIRKSTNPSPSLPSPFMDRTVRARGYPGSDQPQRTPTPYPLLSPKSKLDPNSQLMVT